MKNQTFGIELEMTGITRHIATKVVAKIVDGTIYDTHNHIYHTRDITAPDGRIWKVMRDASIIPQKKVNGARVEASDEYRVEFITPILKYDDIELLQCIIREFRTAGAFRDNSCGIHIHVGAKDMTAEQVCNLVKTMSAYENLIYKALNVDEYRATKWCRKTEQRFLNEVKSKKPETLAELEAVWYNGHSRAYIHYDQSRYRGLNLHALFSKGTIGFRLFNSTLHAGKIKAYIQFCLAMVAKARTDKHYSSTPIVISNDKYSFRCWLMELGLKGDEFRTCRLHMLANLADSNSYSSR